MKDFEAEKLYYGFPVVVLGYKDEQWGYNITTSTSSYSLADTIVMGCFASTMRRRKSESTVLSRSIYRRST